MQVGAGELVTVTLLPGEPVEEVIADLAHIDVAAEAVETSLGGTQLWVTFRSEQAVAALREWLRTFPVLPSRTLPLRQQEELRLELLTKLFRAAPTEAITHWIDGREPDGWLYTLVNEDRSALGAHAWEVLIAELERRDAAGRGQTRD